MEFTFYFYSMNVFDVAVIGSGPAGGMAAYELAKHGFSVAILDKETLPRYKTCGGGLVERGRKLIPFDISNAIEAEFFAVDKFFQKKNLKLTTQRETPIISMVMRDTFDFLIVEKAVENGAKLLQNHKVTSIELGEVNQIHTENGIVQAKFIIAADGALSATAKMLGWKETRNVIPALEYEVEVLPADFERLSKDVRFDIDAVPGGYGWCFPKKKHLSIGVGVLRKSKDNLNLKAFYQAYLKTLGIENIISEDAHGFVIPVSPRTDCFVKNKVFLTGDTAGFADPIVAEGLSNAILSGKLCAEALIESNLDETKSEELYNLKLNKNLLPELKTGVLIAKLFYESQTIRNMLLSKYGQLFAEAMTDVFTGKRTYPADYKKALRQKFKKMIF